MDMTKGKIIGLVGALLTIVATLLPWASGLGAGGVTIATEVMGLLTGFGTLVLILGIISGVMALVGRGVGTVVCGVLALLVTLFWFGAWSFISGLLNWTGGSNSVGYGTYIAVIGSILLIVGGALLIGEKKKMAAAPMPTAAPPTA